MNQLARHPAYWCLVLLGASLATSPSFASESYPAALTSALQLKTIPACTLCHASNLGGAGTVVTKFGRTLQMFGARGGGDTKALNRALANEQMIAVDSDDDGVMDLEELHDGSDPNVRDREPPPPEPSAEGGSASTPTGTGGTVGAPAGPGGSGGTASSGRASSASGGANAPSEPKPSPELGTEFENLETGCGLGRGAASGGWAMLVAAFALFTFRRSRAVRGSANVVHK